MTQETSFARTWISLSQGCLCQFKTNSGRYFTRKRFSKFFPTLTVSLWGRGIFYPWNFFCKNKMNLLGLSMIHDKLKCIPSGSSWQEYFLSFFLYLCFYKTLSHCGNLNPLVPRILHSKYQYILTSESWENFLLRLPKISPIFSLLLGPKMGQPLDLCNLESQFPEDDSYLIWKCFIKH